MKICFSSLCVLVLFAVCQPAATTNTVDPEKEDWTSLFNGTNLEGWDIKIAGYELNNNHNETFVVSDSMIRISYDNYEEFNDAFGHMYYKNPYSYYKMSFDYRFVGEQLKGGATWNVRNSGIMFHSQSAASNELGQGFPVSVELQLLGGLNEGERTTANVCTPGTTVEMGDTVSYDHCINSNSLTYHGDQWVHVEALVMGGESMTFIVEGDTVLSFQRPQVGGGFISAEYDGKDWDQFGVIRDKEDWIAKAGTVLTEGYIALQAESHPIDFKNLKLLDLCGCMDPKARNYKSYYVKEDAKKCEY
ncbi:MAG: 3-keto-disaccharide hydrolase [Cyclobacteriaceae bacterium]